MVGMSKIGGVIARGEPHWRVFDLLAVRPPEAERPFTRDDLYPDALPCLARLRAAGYRVGVAGNQAAQRQAGGAARGGGTGREVKAEMAGQP